jgi:hypothetical protein
MWLPCLALLSACHSPVETEADHIVHRGEDAVLVYREGPAVFAAVKKADAHAVAAAVHGADATALNAMVAAGRVVELARGTRVHVEHESFNERQVRVDEGPLAGSHVWVPFEWLKPVPARRSRT